MRRSIADAVAYAVVAEEEDVAEEDAGIIHDPKAPTPEETEPGHPSPSPSPWPSPTTEPAAEPEPEPEPEPDAPMPEAPTPEAEAEPAAVLEPLPSSEPAAVARRSSRFAATSGLRASLKKRRGRARRIIAAIAARTGRTNGDARVAGKEREPEVAADDATPRESPPPPVASPGAVDASPALAAMDALDAAVRASLAAVRASVKDAGADERAAVDARLASLAAAMRLDDAQLAASDGPSSAGAPPAPRADGAGRGSSSFGAERESRAGVDVDDTDAGHPSSAPQMPADALRGAGGSVRSAPVAGARDKRDDGARARRVQRASHRDCPEQRGGERDEPRMTERRG